MDRYVFLVFLVFAFFYIVKTRKREFRRIEMLAAAGWSAANRLLLRGGGVDGVIHRFEGRNAAVWGSLGPVLPCFGQEAALGGDWPAWGVRVDTGSRSRQEAATGGTGWQYAPTTGRSSERRERAAARVPWTGTDTSRARYARMRAREGADRAGPAGRDSPPGTHSRTLQASGSPTRVERE